MQIGNMHDVSHQGNTNEKHEITSPRMAKNQEKLTNDGEVEKGEVEKGEHLGTAGMNK